MSMLKNDVRKVINKRINIVTIEDINIYITINKYIRIQKKIELQELII